MSDLICARSGSFHFDRWVEYIRIGVGEQLSVISNDGVAGTLSVAEALT